MKDDIFSQLRKGTEQAISIKRGKASAARATIFFTGEEIAKIRKMVGLSQNEFSARFGIPLATIRHWEQGQRQPDSGAKAFLHTLKEQPEAVLAAWS